MPDELSDWKFHGLKEISSGTVALLDASNGIKYWGKASIWECIQNRQENNLNMPIALLDAARALGMFTSPAAK